MKPPAQDSESDPSSSCGIATMRNKGVKYLHQLTTIAWTLLTAAILKDLCPSISRWVVWIGAIAPAPLPLVAGNLIESLLDARSLRGRKDFVDHFGDTV
jgi:hypothetical protein